MSKTRVKDGFDITAFFQDNERLIDHPTVINGRFDGFFTQTLVVWWVSKQNRKGFKFAQRTKFCGITFEDFCAAMYATQRDIYQQFNISFDYFGRSSDAKNHALTQQIFLELEAQGMIEERETQQYFAASDGRFLPDRYVEGTCPHCDYEKARGDQCDNCGRLLDPVDLKNPYSAVSGGTITKE